MHFPDIWEISGGRLTLGEDPFEGLKREVKEEMITFICKPKSNIVSLSDEPQEFQWIPFQEAKNVLMDKFHHLLDSYEEYFLK